MRLMLACFVNPSTTDLGLLLARAWERSGVDVEVVSRELDYEQARRTSLLRTLQTTDSWSDQRSFGELLLRRVAHSRPDVLVIDTPFFSTSQLQRIRKHHTQTTLGFFLGFNHLLTGTTVETIRAAQFLIVHDSYVIPLLQGERYERKRHVGLFRCAADPQEHRPLALSTGDHQRFDCDVAFVGGHSPNRETLLRSLPPCRVKIWGGAAWAKSSLADSYCPEPMFGLAKTKLYNAARIVLNLEDDEKQNNAISNRVPEVLACGGFVLTELRKDLMDTGLVVGDSVEAFATNAELHDKVAHYLTIETARREISARGRRVVLERLTYDHVAADLLQTIRASLQSPQ